MTEPIHWSEIKPEDAVQIQLPKEGIIGPLTEEGHECPWPWDPQQLVGAPLGMYHCPYCGDMQIAGLPHTDYRQENDGTIRQGDADRSGPGEPAQGEGGDAEGAGEAQR